MFDTIFIRLKTIITSNKAVKIKAAYKFEEIILALKDKVAAAINKVKGMEWLKANKIEFLKPISFKKTIEQSILKNIIKSMREKE